VSDESTRSGVLVVDKGRGTTSFDVVAIVRRRLGVRRIGHAGTLDPDATGVLPILVGEATKLTPYLVDQDKEYLATVRFGVTTDTHDVSGRVLSETPVDGLDPTRLADACGAFVGHIKQVPPMYSAVHHQGRRLYELARAGIEVERTPREVTIRSIAIEEIDTPRATLRVVCGSARSICKRPWPGPI
jgi:tRNA pseudouridine55 synthase